MTDLTPLVLAQLSMELRQILYVIYDQSDYKGLMTHPEGKSVTFIIGEAIDRHPGTVHRYLKQLERFGFIYLMRHPAYLRKGKNNGYAVKLVDKDHIGQAHIIKMLISPPNAKFILGLIDVKTREKVA